MRRTTILLAALLLPLAACTSDGDPVADPAACKTALTENYSKAVAAGGKGPTMSPPPACMGLDEETLERLTGEVISEYLDSDQAEKDLEGAVDDALEKEFGESPAPVSVSPECRTWIKAELLDESEEIDATPGYTACGALSDDELQTAIDQVTEELMAEQTP